LKNIGIVLVAALAALLLGSFARFSTETAHAEATGQVIIGCEFFASRIDGNLSNATVSPGDYLAACDGLTEAELDLIDEVLGDEDEDIEEEDFADIDLDDNQIQDGGTSPFYIATTYSIAFLDDDEVVTFDADAGVTVVVSSGGNEIGANDADAETCDAGDDLDCDNSTPSSDDGDGVAVAEITDGTADAGETVDVDVSQADDAGAEFSQTINVVGAPDDVAISVLGKDVIQTSDDATDCADDAEVSDGIPDDLNQTLVQAVVTDNDGTELTRIPVTFEGDSDDIAVVGDDSGENADEPKASSGITVLASGITAAFAVVCGGEDTGTGTVTATIDPNGTAGDSDDEDASVDIEVVGEPDAVALTASPAIIDCNGTATSSVSATVTDADGNNVADGTNVNFSVVALGTANPINATTTDGVASSTITPLSNAVAGVTVIVTAGDAQASIRVDCNAPAAGQTPGAASPTPGSGIGGPDTGTGGYLAEDSAGFPMWTLVALALGSVALVGGGLVTRRASK
jgi:hypothetical protein